MSSPPPGDLDLLRRPQMRWVRMRLMIRILLHQILPPNLTAISDFVPRLRWGRDRWR